MMAYAAGTLVRFNQTFGTTGIRIIDNQPLSFASMFGIVVDGDVGEILSSKPIEKHGHFVYEIRLVSKGIEVWDISDESFEVLENV